MADNLNDIPGITRAFDIEDKDDAWHLRCKLCKMGWALSKRKHIAPGNILALLNHAAGCEKKAHAKNKNALDGFFGRR